MPGHSTVVHQAIGPAPAAAKELVHVEAKPHRGKIKVHAHVMEGGNSTHNEHVVSNWGEAHQKMGEYMAGPAEAEHAGEPQQTDRQESVHEFENVPGVEDEEA
jgi:hypothetical protein